jgi:hypothetical protein
VIKGAREELRGVAGDLSSIRYRLLGVQASIPASPLEASRGDLEGDPDVATELRSAIGVGIHDYLEPLIRGVLRAAEDRPDWGMGRNAEMGSAEGDPQSIAHLDLSAYSEETQRALYKLVAQDNFLATEEEPPEEGWVPKYTPEEAGLEVVYAWGRWFATWWKLELPEDLPESKRREILLLEEDHPNRPGTLRYIEV